MLFHVLGIFSGLAAAAFAARATGRSDVVVLGSAYVLAAAWLSATRFPDPVWLAVLAAFGAGIGLWRQQLAPVVVGLGGIMAASWAIALEASGLPAPPAHAIAMAVPAASATLALRRRNFAPAALMDEALMMIVAAGIVLAAAPTVMQGFAMAVALKAAPLGAETPHSMPWALAIAAICVLGGCAHAAWRRR